MGVAVKLSNCIGKGFTLQLFDPKVKGLNAVNAAFVTTEPVPAPEQVPLAVPGRSSHDAPFQRAMVRSGQLLIPLAVAFSKYKVRLAFPLPTILSHCQYSYILTSVSGALTGERLV